MRDGRGELLLTIRLQNFRNGRGSARGLTHRVTRSFSMGKGLATQSIHQRYKAPFKLWIVKDGCVLFKQHWGRFYGGVYIGRLQTYFVGDG